LEFGDGAAVARFVVIANEAAKMSMLVIFILNFVPAASLKRRPPDKVAFYFGFTAGTSSHAAMICRLWSVSL
jgi:hypothetical protein